MSRPDKLRILVVEDSPTDVLILRDALLDLPGVACEIEQVPRLTDAIERLGGASFDAVLLDLGLPDSRGLDSFARVRDAAPTVPVLVLTGLDDESVGLSALRLGAQEYLVKGVMDPRLLRRLILHAIERQQINTQLRRTQDELRRSEARFRDVIEASADAIMIVDQTGVVRLANPAAARMFSASGATLRGQPFGYPVSTAVVTEHAFPRPDGETGIAEMSGVEVEWDDLPCTLAVLRDITERRQAEARVREQANLLDRTSDAIVVRGLDGTVRFWSKGAEQVYGWSAAEAVSRVLNDEMIADRTGFRQALDILHREGAWFGELDQLRRDGTRITLECRWTMLVDTQGRPESVLSINTDVTERKRLETQLLRAQRMSSIGTLAGGIAHDLNNVLTPILMGVGMLRMSRLDAPLQETLGLIEASARHGAQLVKQVLDFGRGVKGERVLVSPAHVARDIGQIVKDTFPRTIKYQVNAPADLWAINGDPTQLHQVLLNLCLNARDAMPDGGSLSVDLVNVQVSSETMSAAGEPARPGLYVMIQVTDTGTGIPLDQQERIFDPFFTTKDIGKGTGLGLSTVLAIVKSHGGFCQLLSADGQGTTFKVHFPALSESVAPKPTAENVEFAVGHGQTILVIDDEEIIRSVFRKTLERFGYRVLLAANGADGVNAFALPQTKVDLVITDLNMPVMGGFDAILALRAIEPSVRIIATSGLPANETVQRLSDLAVARFIPKPYEPEELLKIVQAALKD